MMTIVKKNSELVTCGKESENVNHQHNSMSWTAYYDNVCQTHRSDKNDSEWYSKSLKQNFYMTQVKRYIDSLYSRSDSKKDYKVIEFFKTEQESQEDHYFNDSSQKDFS